jgi:hypothetical protein
MQEPSVDGLGPELQSLIRSRLIKGSPRRCKIQVSDKGEAESTDILTLSATFNPLLCMNKLLHFLKELGKRGHWSFM